MIRLPQSKQTPLAQARRERGWTQEYVAQQLDVSVDTVRQWERGRHSPYQSTIHKICQLFEMTPGELGFMREPDEEEKMAAWKLYVELITRVPVIPLKQDEGLLREALSSLYSLFQTTRSILSSHSPALARDTHGKNSSLGYIAISMLNTTLRPLLARWHPLLLDYEQMRPPSVGAAQHERRWERYVELHQEIVKVRKVLVEYATTFAQMAQVPLFLPEESE